MVAIPWLSGLILLAASTSTTSTPKIRKCCPVDELMMGFSQCSPLNASTVAVDATVDSWWWLEKKIQSQAGLEEGDVAFAARPECDLRMKLYQGDYRLIRVNETVLLETPVESSALNTENDDTAWHSFPADDFCLDGMVLEKGGIHTFAILCPCRGTLPCVRKCCQNSKVLNTETMRCTRVNDTDDFYDWAPKFDAQDGEDHRFFHLPGTNPTCAEDETHTIVVGHVNESLGLVFLSDGGIKVTSKNRTQARDTFCGDLSTLGEEVLVHCMRKMTHKEMWMSTAYGVLFVIGSLALLLVVFVSLLLPDMRRQVHGRMALAHNVMLLIAYITTGALHFVGVYGDGMTTNSCKLLSFIMQFSFLSSFFWLNVMCIDIFWVFSGLRPIQGSMMQRDKKKFAYYSIYAWGSTCIISITTMALEFGPREAYFRPAFGEGKQYFFNNRAASLLFFYGPMAALLLGNLVLFVYTAIKIYFAKRSTAILNSADSSTNKKNKQRGRRPLIRLALYVKLFALMGVTWVFEVVSWAVGGDAGGIWFFFDAVNLLRAVFVFVIFCCKRSVLDKVRRRLGCAGAREAGASTYSADTRTTSSNISRTRNATPLATRKNSQKMHVTAL